MNSIHRVEDEITEIECKMQNDKSINWNDEKMKLENEKKKLIKELDESRSSIINEIKKNNISRLKKFSAMFDEFK